MCKKVKKIAATLVLVFALTGLLTVSAFAEDNYQGRVVAEITLPGYTTYELHENEVIRIPLVYTDTTITPFGTGYLTGNAGYVQVTDTPGNIHWSVYVNRPADRFKGWVGVTDCTTGLSC